MAVPTNIITSQDIDAALSQEFVMNFQHDFDLLAELLGVFGVETRAAGTALYQLSVSGSLNNSVVDGQYKTSYAKTTDVALVSGKTYYTRSGSNPNYTYTAVGAASLDVANIGNYYERTDTPVSLGSSSGTGYIEGDLVALSHYEVEKVPIGDLSPVPYRKMTTAKAILQNGYEGAVLKTDKLMLSQIRNAVIQTFIQMLDDGQASPTGTIAGLQEALALTDATILSAMEEYMDSTDAPLVHFVNRFDAARYLANAPITTQSAFGLTYLENFLGVERVFLTNLVQSGHLYATSAANIHVFGCDFGELSRGGLVYETESNGLIGVAHKGAYDYASAETNVMLGCQMVPEVLDYIGTCVFTPDA